MSGAPGRGWRGVFSAPIAIGAAQVAGLAGALLYGEAGKVVSWITLSIPLVIAAAAWRHKG